MTCVCVMLCSFERHHHSFGFWIDNNEFGLSLDLVFFELATLGLNKMVGLCPLLPFARKSIITIIITYIKGKCSTVSLNFSLYWSYFLFGLAKARLKLSQRRSLNVHIQHNLHITLWLLTILGLVRNWHPRGKEGSYNHSLMKEKQMLPKLLLNFHK